MYCLRSHSYVWFQGWTPKAFTPGGKRANLHFHENNLRGNLWNFQAIHKVCTSSSTLKMLVASSEENKDYCKMQIRSNLSEILCCSICSVGGICCNQLDQSALHWETSEFKHILKFLNPGKISQSFKLQNVAEIWALCNFRRKVWRKRQTTGDLKIDLDFVILTQGVRSCEPFSVHKMPSKISVRRIFASSWKMHIFWV